MSGLNDKNIWVSSYITDGSATERRMAKLWAKTLSTKTWSAADPRGSDFPLITNTYYLYHNKPVVILQDAFHFKKTMRNALFSGAHQIVMGNYAPSYAQVREVATNDSESPIFKRDVDKFDRQDDRAAARIFSGAMLQHVIEKHSEWIGLIIYLFLFGELADAYLSRSMPNGIRLSIAFRMKFFFLLWDGHLHEAGYPANCRLPAQTKEICTSIIDGLISLILIHRDHEKRIPLCPYLHTTAPCEHAFGSARQIVAEFSLLDFIYMVPKLDLLISRNFNPNADPRARAAGYYHSWQDIEGFSSDASNYPSDEEIADIMGDAWKQACSLCSILGFSADDALPNPYSFTLPPFKNMVLNDFDEAFFVDLPADEWDDEQEEEDYPRAGVTRLLQEYNAKGRVLPDEDADIIESVAYAHAAAEMHFREQM
jgi:hypothetical protein